MELDNQITTKTEEIYYPYITFKINSANYCISSQLVSSMTMLTEIISIPDSPEYILGLMRHKSGIVPMIDIRILLGMPSLETLYNDFVSRVDQRKTDHINWVNEFKRCVNEKEPFKLATDPHMCAFGKWFYAFKESENKVNTVEVVLNKIETPHAQLHSLALVYANNSQDEEVCISAVKEAQRLCYEIILPLLDELKEVFKHQYKSMAIILESDDKLQGITVDEVNSIKYFNYETQSEKIKNSPTDNYVRSVIKDEDGSLYLEIDSDAIIALTRASVETETV